MPLPQALASRLAKRGIIKLPAQTKEQADPEVPSNVQEEIIAEDYDDAAQTEEEVEKPSVPQPPEKFDVFQGWHTCPNKWNVYHVCSPSCQEYWNETKEIDQEYNRRRIKMLFKYPLPVHWHEILDIGIRRYYYWNTETNLVSWLPPGHPKCRVSPSAAELRKKMSEDKQKRIEEERKMGSDGEGRESSEEEEDGRDKEEESNRRKKRPRVSSAKEDKPDSDADSIEGSSPPPKDKRHNKKEPQSGGRRRGDKERGREKERRGGKEKRKQEDNDPLDPMDPASYSECPRGTWSSGLPDKDEAKTGVDTTASGPLFQMRPYPNPGAILRGNASSRGIGPKKPS